jgi:hypothetical protein
MRDKLWFLVSARHQSSDETVADVPVQITTPQGEIINSYLDTYVRGPSLRLTWQASQKHKLATFVQRWWKRKGRTFAAGQDPRTGQFRDPRKAHHTVGNIKYTSPVTNRILLEGGYSWTLFDWHGGPDIGNIRPRNTPEWFYNTQRISNQRMVHPLCAYDTGCTDWGSSLSQRQDNTRIVFDGRISYVTGSHSFKFGYTHEIGPDGRMANEYNGDLQQRYNNGQPNQVTVWNTPLEAPGRVQYDSAFFMQDTWTIKRLTVNPGLRIEWFAAGMDETSSPAGRFSPERFYPAQYDLIKWGPDYAPRFAVVYDLFGDGRTALKTNFSKYHRQYDADPFLAYADAGLRSENRNWFDCALNATGTACSGVVLPTNRDDIVQDHEIGPSPSAGNFGLRSGAVAGDLRRQYNLEFTAGVQHQVAPRLAVGFMLFKRQVKDIQLTDRTRITFADYTAFNTTIPASDWANIARNPDVAAVLNQNEAITLYNLNQASNANFNQALVDRSSDDNKSLYTGMEASFSMRLTGGSVIFGSWTAERNTSVFCESDDNPNGPTTGDLYQGRPVSQGGRFCDQRNFDIPFIHEFKLAGNYSLPYGVDFGAVLQSYAGLERVVTWQPAASLYPNGQRTQAQTIVLNEPGSLFGERWDQLDVNFKKNIRYGNKVHTFQFDLFNVFNNNSIRTQTDAVGTSLGQVTAIMPGRFPRLAYQFKW